MAGSFPVLRRRDLPNVACFFSHWFVSFDRMVSLSDHKTSQPDTGHNLGIV